MRRQGSLNVKISFHLAVFPINTFWHISGIREQWLVASITPPNNKQKNKWNFGVQGESRMSGESDLLPAPLQRHLLSPRWLRFLFHLFLPSRIQLFPLSFAHKSTLLQLLHFKYMNRRAVFMQFYNYHPNPHVELTDYEKLLLCSSNACISYYLSFFFRSWNNFKKQNFVSSPDTLRSVFSFTDYRSVSQLGWNEHTYRSVSYYKYTLFTTVSTHRTMFGQYRLFSTVLDERHMWLMRLATDHVLEYFRTLVFPPSSLP